MKTILFNIITCLESDDYTAVCADSNHLAMLVKYKFIIHRNPDEYKLTELGYVASLGDSDNFFLLLQLAALLKSQGS